MEKINFALIGTGNIAKTHLAALMSCQQANLVGLLSLNDYNKSSYLAKKFKLRAYRSLEEVLTDKEIEAVDIVAKNDLHVKIGTSAAGQGKHVLVEKPIGLSLKGADKLINACKENNVKLSIISQNRFAQPYIRLREAIQNNKLGPINLVVAGWIIHKNKEYFTSSPWRKSEREAGGGFLMMNAIHYIDLLQWLLGPVVSVSAEVGQFKQRKIEVEDTAIATLNFKSGAKGIIYGTTAASRSLPPFIKIYGSKDEISVEDKQYLICSEGLFAKQIGDFISSIKENRKPLVDGLEGRKSLEIVLAIYRSAKLKKEVSL